MQLWTVKPGEVLRVPAMRELTGFTLWSYATMDPTAGMAKMMKQLSGFSDAFEPSMKEMHTGTMVLRMHMDMFMPAGSDPSGASFDPTAPFMQMNDEMVEISTAPVPDSVLQIPEGYQEAAAKQ